MRTSQLHRDESFPARRNHYWKSCKARINRRCLRTVSDAKRRIPGAEVEVRTRWHCVDEGSQWGLWLSAVLCCGKVGSRRAAGWNFHLKHPPSLWSVDCQKDRGEAGGSTRSLVRCMVRSHQTQMFLSRGRKKPWITGRCVNQRGNPASAGWRNPLSTKIQKLARTCGPSY